jgi:PST family polysaccharide transporter
MLKDIRAFFYNYLHLIFGKSVLATVIAFLSTFLIVRILLPEQYGVFVLFSSVAGIIAIFTNWNSSAVVRFGREEYLNEGSVRKTFWATYMMLLPVYAICFVIVFVFSDSLTRYIGSTAGYYYLIFLYVLLSNLSNTLPVFFQAVGRMKHFSYLPLAMNILFLISLVIIYTGSLPVSVEMMVALYLGCNLLTDVLAIWFLRRDILPACLPWQWMRRCFSYSWPVIFGGISSRVVMNVDQLVIRMFMALSFVGIYNIAYRIQTYLVMLPALSISLMFPLITSLVVYKEEDKIPKYINVYAPQITFFWALLLSVFVIFGHEILLIFGPDYTAATFALAVLLVGMAFRIFNIIESPLLTSYSLVKQTVMVSVAISAINLGLDFLLIPLIGLAGAAVATTIAFACGAVFSTFLVRKRLRMNIFRSFPWIFPVILSFVGFVFISGLVPRIAFLLVLLVFCLLIAKRSAVFNSDSLMLLDSIEMPAFLRKTIKRAYAILI